jgi:outer membrane receptor protein involved in Fe transport
MLFVVWSSSAISEPDVSITIAPQPLPAALAEFAHQTGLQLVYVSKIAAKHDSKGVRAARSSSEALTQLLDGTQLRFEFLNARTVRIYEPGAPYSPTSPGPQQQYPAGNRLTALKEVIVVGLRGEEAGSVDEFVQNVPASVSILSGDTLESRHLTQLSDYTDSIPGLYVASLGSPGQAYVILRGVSTFSGASSVGFYIDDTPIGPSGPYNSASTFPLDMMPYDLERLEVLRGPQGTQFGAPSEVGLIRYVLRKPSVSNFEARFGADVETVAGAAGPGISWRALVNAPLIDGTLGMRVSAYSSSTPGYIDNNFTGAKDVNGLHEYGGRAALLWTPVDSLAVNLNALWIRIASDSATTVSAFGLTTVPNTGDAYVVTPSTPPHGLTESAAFEAPFTNTLAYYSATLNWNPGHIEVSSATAWSKTRQPYSLDSTQYVSTEFPGDLARTDDDQGIEKFSEELRVASTQGGRIGWLVGAFYTHEADTYQQDVYYFDSSYHPLQYFQHYTLPAEFAEWALFGDLSWRVTERLDLTGGLRYDHNHQYNNAMFHDLYGPQPDEPGTSSGGVTTWMADARYRPGPALTLYARVATGYQPSFPNPAGHILDPQIPVAVPPEYLTNYELGIKSEFLDHRARIDFALFNIDYHPIQECTVNDSFCTGNDDADKVHSKGLELTALYLPLTGLRLQYTAAYTQVAFTALDPNGCCTLAGYQLPNVPKWGMSFSADYEWVPASAWTAHAGLVWHRMDQQWGSGAESFSSGEAFPAVVLPAYSVLDLFAEAARGRYRLHAFAKNVANTRAYLTGSVVGNDLSNLYQVNYVPLQPRTVGVGLDYTFR